MPASFTIDQDRFDAVIVQPGQRHWGIFIRLCRETKATANHVPGAYLPITLRLIVLTTELTLAGQGRVRS